MNALPMARSPLLTSSRLKATRRCMREAFYGYEMGIRPLQHGEALVFGDLIHKALEAWWKAPDAERLQAAEAALDTHYTLVNEFEWSKARVMIAGYHHRWKDDACLYDVLAVEHEFRAKLKNPETGGTSPLWLLAGKIDVIVRERMTLRVLIVEHKTSSEDCSLGSDYWRRLRLDAQIGIYYAGGRAAGYDVEGCLYDVLKKPGQRPLKANKQRSVDETPHEYGIRCAETIAAAPHEFYSRGEVVRLDSELEELAWEIWQQARMIRDAQLSNKWPRNPDACIRYGYTCPYWNLCTGVATADDPSAFRTLPSVHPELTTLPEEEAHAA